VGAYSARIETLAPLYRLPGDLANQLRHRLLDGERDGRAVEVAPSAALRDEQDAETRPGAVIGGPLLNWLFLAD